MSSELIRALFTAALTVIGGVLIYVFGQVLWRFCLEPIHDLRRVVGRLGHLAFHQGNPVFCEEALYFELVKSHGGAGSLPALFGDVYAPIASARATTRLAWSTCSRSMSLPSTTTTPFPSASAAA